MQQDQIQKFQRLIASSRVLQEGERQSWLQLLPIMNDKQLTELEQILSEPDLRPTPTSSPAVMQHIVNLPTEFDWKKAPAQQAPKAAPPPGDWLSHMNAVLHEKELPAGEHQQSAPIAPPSITERFGIPKIPQQRPQPVPQPQQKPHQTPPPAPPPPPPQFHPNSTQSRGEAPRPTKPITLNSLQDIGVLTSDSLRASGEQAIVDGLFRLVKASSYFDVLSAFEHSPLYTDYIAAGHAAMEQQGSFEPLSKTEFEAIADILSKIQVN